MTNLHLNLNPNLHLNLPANLRRRPWQTPSLSASSPHDPRHNHHPPRPSAPPSPIAAPMDERSPSADVSLSEDNSAFGSATPDLALSLGAGLGDLDLPLGFADQACKECRRRKSKCNKAIPTCNLCVKYRRHCLYEKHSRTPLTRKWVSRLDFFKLPWCT